MGDLTYWKRTKVSAMGAKLEIGVTSAQTGTLMATLNLDHSPPRPTGWPEYFQGQMLAGYQAARADQVAAAFAAVIRHQLPDELLKAVIEDLAGAAHSHTCAECGGGFTPLHTKAIYCCPACKARAFRSRSGGKP